MTSINSFILQYLHHNQFNFCFFENENWKNENEKIWLLISQVLHSFLNTTS